MKFFIAFGVIVLTKFLLNLYNFIRIKILNKYHMDWLANKKDNFGTYRQEVLNLFSKAHIKNICTPTAQPVGYGKIAHMNVDVFTMFPSNLQIIAVPAMKMFEEAEGVFRKNMFDSLNPLYWLELIIFLPKNILIYLGLSMEKSVSKLCNLILTFLWWLFCTLITLFNPEIKQYIIELFSNLK